MPPTIVYGRLFQGAYPPAWLVADMKGRVADLNTRLGLSVRPDRGGAELEPRQLKLAV